MPQDEFGVRPIDSLFFFLVQYIYGQHMYIELNRYCFMFVLIWMSRFSYLLRVLVTVFEGGRVRTWENTFLRGNVVFFFLYFIYEKQSYVESGHIIK